MQFCIRRVLCRTSTQIEEADRATGQPQGLLEDEFLPAELQSLKDWQLDGQMIQIERRVP